jgi:choline-sulfatase
MMDIAATDEKTKPIIGQPIDGRSLWTMATTGKEDHGHAIGEYCAEMTAHPVIMIRRDQYKYIHCDSDAPMMFEHCKRPA